MARYGGKVDRLGGGEQLARRQPIPPRRRRHNPRRAVALRHDPLLLRQRPAPPGTCRNNLEPRDLRNRRMVSHTPMSSPSACITQGGARRSDTLNQTVENLQADLAVSINKIAELEKAKAEAERAVKQAERAKLNAENAKQEVERARIAEKMTSDALVAQLRADKVAAGAKSARWENALYGSVGGLIVVLTASAIGFRMNRHKASVSKQQVWELGSKPIEATPHRQKSEAELEPSALSPEIAIFETAFERELEEEVTTVNAARDKASLRTDRSYHSIYISCALAGLLTVVSALAFLSGLLGYWEPSSGVVVLSLIFGFTIGVMWLGSEVSEIFRSGRRRRAWGRWLQSLTQKVGRC